MPARREGILNNLAPAERGPVIEPSGPKSLLDQQSPGLEEGFTVGQEAEAIINEWSPYSDVKGRAAGLLRMLTAEIKAMALERDRLRCAAGLGRSYGLDCDELERTPMSRARS